MQFGSNVNIKNFTETMKKRMPGSRGVRAAMMVSLLLLITACTVSSVRTPPRPAPPKAYQVFGQWYEPLAHSSGFVQCGRASWYGGKFHGRKTASGEVYDQYGMTAAHKTLPLGTWVKVINEENGRRVVVKVNDRGPFVSGRIIDLSYTAAKELDMLDAGTARVTVIALDGPAGRAPAVAAGPACADPIFRFQVGAFREPENAERLKKNLEHIYKNVHIQVFPEGTTTFYRVRLGRYTSREAIEQDRAHLMAAGFDSVAIVAECPNRSVDKQDGK